MNLMQGVRDLVSNHLFGKAARPAPKTSDLVLKQEPHPDNTLPWEQATFTPDDLFKLIKDEVDENGNLPKWPTDGYYKAKINRTTVVEFSTLYRCVTLTAAVIASLLTKSLRVVNIDTGEEVKNDHVTRVMELIRETHDGENPSHTFWEDLISDYCLDGNALVAVDSWETRNRPYRLRRMRATDAEVVHNYRMRRSPDYLVYEAEIEGVPQETIPNRNMMHIRWPKMFTPQKSSRFGFASAPVEIIRPALSVGIRGDQYMLAWFLRGLRSRLHLDYDVRDEDGGIDLDDDLKKDIRDAVNAYEKLGQSLITFGAKSSEINSIDENEGMQQTRDYQNAECARVYGIPSPLYGVDISRWGGAIEQLAKLYYRFGATNHLERFLAPMALRLLERRTKFEVDATEFLRGDSEGIQKLLMAIQGNAQTNPIASRDEMRRLAGLPRDIDGEIEKTLGMGKEPGSGSGSGPGSQN